MTVVQNPLLRKSKDLAENIRAAGNGGDLKFKQVFLKNRSREGYAKGNAKLSGSHKINLRKPAVREGTRRVREG